MFSEISFQENHELLGGGDGGGGGGCHTEAPCFSDS